MIQRNLGVERAVGSSSNSTATATSNEDIAVLLREIRDELRQNNQNSVAPASPAAAAAAAASATAPPADSIV